MQIKLTILVDLPADGVVLAVIGAILVEVHGPGLLLSVFTGGLEVEGVGAEAVSEGAALMAFQRVT